MKSQFSLRKIWNQLVSLSHTHTYQLWNGQMMNSKLLPFPFSSLQHILYPRGVVVVLSLTDVQLFMTPRTAARQASLSFTISRSLFKLLSIESVMASNHLILCHPPVPLDFNLSQYRGVLQWVDSASSDQSIGASASAPVLPMNIQGWSPLGLTGLISLLSKELSRVFWKSDKSNPEGK